MAFTTFTICNAAPVFSLFLCYTVLYCIIYYILYIKYFVCITQNTHTYVCTTSVSSQTSPVLQTYPSSPSPTNQDSVLLKLNSSPFFASSLVFLISLTGTIRSFLNLWVCWFHFLGALTSVLSPASLVCFLFRLLREPPQLFCFQSSAPLTFCVAYRMLFLRHDCVLCSHRSILCLALPCSVPGSWPLWASLPSGFQLGLADERHWREGGRELPLKLWQGLHPLRLLSSRLW